MLVDIWPSKLRSLVESRGGYLLTLCSAIRPVFDALIREQRDAEFWLDAWKVRDEQVLRSGFWWDGKEVKDASTVTLFVDMDDPAWSSNFRVLKGAYYIDSGVPAKFWLIKDFRMGYPKDYVRSDGITYSDLLEVDIVCSNIGAVTLVTAPPGTGHGIRLKDGLLEHLATTVGARLVDGMVPAWKRLTVARNHQLVELKGTAQGVWAFTNMYGYEGTEEGLYWLGAEDIGRIPVPSRVTATQNHYRYPIFWGDGTTLMIRSDGSWGTQCRYLKEDADYRGNLIDPGVGNTGTMVVEFNVPSALAGGASRRFKLVDVGVVAGQGQLVPAETYNSDSTVLGLVNYVTGEIALASIDLGSPGIVSVPFSKYEPVLVSFQREGTYTRIPARFPLMDEVPADFRDADYTCSETPPGPITFADMTISDLVAPALPYTSASVWEFKLTSASETVQFPIIPEQGTAVGSWGKVSGRWKIVDFAGQEHYAETIVWAPLTPDKAWIRVYGTLPVTMGLASSVTYICPEGSTCGFGLSNKVTISLVQPHPEAFEGAVVGAYTAALKGRYVEVIGANEEVLEV
jgi:hypothetical protein